MSFFNPNESQADATARIQNLSDLVKNPIVAPGPSTKPMNAWASNQIDSNLESQDMFFRFHAIKGADFNKDFGYEMWIFDARENKMVAQFQFPINPQNITENVQPSTTLEATMKGVYENHNGAVFRPITISGTTGTNVIPPSIPSPGNSSDLQRTVEYAFQNTIKAANSVVNQANKTLKAFSGNKQAFSGPLNYGSDDKTINTLHTGYQCIHDLARFLDYYLAGKKQTQNKSWRLYFIMNKDRKYYACSLGPYSITKAAGTTEYQYTINMTAYRREKDLPGLTRGTQEQTSRINAANTQNILSNLINGLTQARHTVAYANRVMAGIRSDIQSSFIAPLGQIVLLAKDIAGLANNMSDFAFSGSTLKAMQESFKQAFTDNSSIQTSVAKAIGSPSHGQPLTNIGPSGKPRSIIYRSAQDKLASGQAEQFQTPTNSADPLGNLFVHPEDHPEVFDQFQIDDMNLPDAVTSQINGLLDTVRQFTADDLITRRNQIIDFATSISSALGGGNATYNALKGLPPPPVNYRKLSVDDVNLLSALNDIAIQTDKFISLLDLAATDNSQDYYQFYSDYAVSQGLKFNTNNISRFFVPFPLGASLEQLALQYLGSPDRWIEIAALNSLKAPYVDEVGYFVPVLASAGGDTLTVADSRLMYIGQVVNVASDQVRASKRKIAGIDRVNSFQTIITFVDIPGSPLTVYKPTDNAKIQAFMPDTVNSNMLLAIPSSVPATYQTSFKTSPEIDQLNSLYQMAKVDFMLDPTGDIIITGGGDIQLAYGLTNLIQAAVMKIQSEPHSMLQLPTFGNPVEAGVNTADMQASDILNALNAAFLNDPRFTGIVAGEVSKAGPEVSVSIMVGLQNTNVTLPIQAQLPR
jgi:hypothetical protein